MGLEMERESKKLQLSCIEIETQEEKDENADAPGPKRKGITRNKYATVKTPIKEPICKKSGKWTNQAPINEQTLQKMRDTEDISYQKETGTVR